MLLGGLRGRQAVKDRRGNDDEHRERHCHSQHAEGALMNGINQMLVGFTIVALVLFALTLYNVWQLERGYRKINSRSEKVK